MASRPYAAMIKAAAERQWGAPGLVSVDRRAVRKPGDGGIQAQPGARCTLSTPEHVKRNVAAMTAHYGPAAPAYVGRQQMGPNKAK